MPRINEIIDTVTGYHPGADTAAITKAYVYSAKMHQGQTRRSGAPYLSHPLAVAGLLATVQLDVASICAGLVHDVVEDTDADIDDIKNLLGPEVAGLVDGVTKITLLSATTKTAQQAESLRKMILAMADDIRVLLVKLADRLHNMRTLGYLSTEQQKRIALETRDIYAPMAHRLGIRRWHVELQDLAFYYLDPETYREIQQGVATRQSERKKFILEVTSQIKQVMADNGIKCRVNGRSKHFSSIHEKMLRRHVEIDELYDLVAFRVITPKLKDCYDALGVIHNTWKPVPGRFRDYIGMPKANMYQSLHTAVVGLGGQRMEVQIRTEEMHQVAEEGIAAHWRYKEQDASDGAEAQRFVWLRRLLEWQREQKDPSDYMDSLRMDLFPEEIFVFTPTGEVKELPKGATPVDFAYAIHTEVGHHCVGAKVNGRMVPLRHALSTGDQVEILTQANHTPSKDWIKFVVSGRARSKLRSYFREQDRERSVALGRDLLEREFKKRNLTLASVLRENKLDPVVEEFSFNSVDSLLASVAYGKVSPRHILNRVLPSEEEEPEAGFLKRLSRKRKRPQGGIKVKGVDDVLVRYAKCCNPLPGDKVKGFITRGRGVSVHTANCKDLEHMDPERLVDLEWDVPESQVWPVRIQVVGNNRTGILADITGVLKQRDIGIIEASARTDSDGHGISTFLVEVRNTRQLKRVLADLKRVKDVDSVRRLS